MRECPFCGGDNVEVSYKDTFNGDFRRGVYCADCCAGVYPYYENEAEAIAAWNSRTPIEYDDWFYLPKPKERIVVYGEPEITRTENGYKVWHIADVVDEAARKWGEELGKYIMQRICEIWNTRAELCGGTLTAEQVRGVLLLHLPHREYYSIEQTDAWQVIADELNATLGSGTCEMKADGAHCMNGVEFYECCSCGEYTCIPTVMGKSEPPNYCPNCGRKIVSP